MNKPQSFTDEQKQYLAGFAMGSDVARAVRGLPVLSGTASGGTTVQVGGNGSTTSGGPDQIAYEAQDRTISSGGKLCGEEKAKREKNGVDIWDEIAGRANANEFPKGTDVFLTKFHGLFYVAPAQNSYMCRLRIPGGELYAYQLEGLAHLSDRSAGGYIDITTRANLQFREIPADQSMNVLYGIRELGIASLGSGADNIRNVTASPLSGIDSDELIETIPIAKRMHHYIMNHRDMYGLPRKFNIAFDGGGKISALDDTNDIGFHAVRVNEESADEATPAGIYFQLTLGGITGHHDFARDTGILVPPEEALDLARGIVCVFVKHGDRTDRKKARLKYLLDDWGFDKFLAEVEAEMGASLRRVDASRWERPEVEDRLAHVDFHPQAQEGKNYVGVVFPAGRMTSDQARGLARIARRYGSGRIALTVWQNLLITDIGEADIEAVKDEIAAIGLDYKATSFRAGLVACTGNAGCKFAASDTKAHAVKIAEYLEHRLELDSPINIHLTGCHHSCAQHYIGDIGLLGTKVEVDEDMVEGYHVHVGGGWGKNQGVARLIFESLPFDEVKTTVAGLVSGFLDQRESNDETFASFASRKSDDELRELVNAVVLNS